MVGPGHLQQLEPVDHIIRAVYWHLRTSFCKTLSFICSEPFTKEYVDRFRWLNGEKKKNCLVLFFPAMWHDWCLRVKIILGPVPWMVLLCGYLPRVPSFVCCCIKMLCQVEVCLDPVSVASRASNQHLPCSNKDLKTCGVTVAPYIQWKHTAKRLSKDRKQDVPLLYQPNSARAHPVWEREL